MLRAEDLKGVDRVAGTHVLAGDDTGVEVDLVDTFVRAPVRRAIVDREELDAG